MTSQNGKEIYNEKTHESFSHDSGKSFPQILAIFIVSVGALSDGIIFVWSSPFSLKIVKDKVNYNLTEDEASYFIVFQPVGMIFASMFIFKVTDFLGRKKSVLLIAVPHLISWIIVIFARNKWWFYAARFVAGVGNCCFFCGIPPYVGEITTPTIRGYLGNFPTFIFYGGFFLITVLGSYLDVKTTAYICITFPVLFLILVHFILPESPYQLIKDRKYDRARNSIKWLRRKNNIEEDFQNMKNDVERQMSERGNWKDLFTIKSNRRALRAGIFLRFSQQLCGIAVFATYTQIIFQKAGGLVSPQHSSMIFIGLMWILNGFFSFAVEKFGRKPSHFYSSLCCGISLVFLSIYFGLEQYKIANLDKLNWFPIAGMVVYICVFSFGLGVVPNLMLGELFSASVKSKGLSLLMTFFGISVFVTSNLYRLLSSYIGFYSPFLVYGICCFVSTILTLRWVPETKGKTLEEIQQSLKK